MTRTKEREQAFILIFEKCFRNDSGDEIIADAELIDEIELSDFSKNTFMGVYENLDFIDTLISENISGWKIDRLPKVTLSILRLAVFEMKFCDDIPVSVSINEAVELSKKFATTDDASYINGVLGSAARKIGDE